MRKRKNIYRTMSTLTILSILLTNNIVAFADLSKDTNNLNITIE